MHVERLSARTLLTTYLPDPNVGDRSFIYAFPPESLAFRTEALDLNDDGYLPVAGYVTDAQERIDFALALFDSDGELQTDFADEGWFIRSGGTDPLNRAVAVKLTSNAKILVAGAADDTPKLNLFRLTLDGDLDTAFSGDGFFSLDTTGSVDFGDIASIHALAGNQTLLATSARVSGGDAVFALIQLDAAGELDAGFGTGGIVITDLAAGTEIGDIVQVQSDGRILIAGATTEPNARSAVRRYAANGDIDLSFGVGGIASVDLSTGTDDRFNALAIDDTGTIVAAGERDGNDQIAIVRFSTSGVLDTAFANAGVSVVTPSPGQGVEGFFAQSILIRSDDTLLVGLRPFNSQNVPLRDSVTLVVSAAGGIDESVLYNGLYANGAARELNGKLYFLTSDGAQRFGNDNISIANGTLDIQGTAGRDLITVDGTTTGRVNVYYNTTSGYLSLDAIQRIVIDTGESSDSVQSTDLALPTTINAGDGYDTVVLIGNHTSQLPLAGVPVLLDGGDGPDYMTLSSSGPTSVTLVGGAGNDRILGNHAARIYGNGGKDSLYGGASRQLINGGAGNDNIDGGPGNDILYGAGGEDTLNGNSGKDRLYGDVGHDLLVGGSGGDTLDGGAGLDTLTGRSGDDLLYGADSAADILKGGDGNDTVASIDDLLDELLEIEVS